MAGRRYSGFVFLNSPGRVHIVAWDPQSRRWRVPCGLVSPNRGAVTYCPDKPLCKTCDSLTQQTTLEDVREIGKDAPR